MSGVDIPALVERVRELDAKATKGPWEHNGYDGHPAMAVWTPDPELEDGNSSAKMICREGDYFGEESRAPVEERAENIQLIALYRTAAPVLADEVVRLTLSTLAWVIVHKDSPPGQPMYFTGEFLKYDPIWTAPGDHMAAIRFCRKEDAERMLPSVGKCHLVEDHVWITQEAR